MRLTSYLSKDGYRLEVYADPIEGRYIVAGIFKTGFGGFTLKYRDMNKALAEFNAIVDLLCDERELMNG